MTWDEEREKEWALLIEEFSVFIRAHVHKFRVANFGVDAEDIVQDVHIKLWKIIRDEKKINNYASYIKKVVNSSVIDHLRKHKRDESVLLHEKAKTIAEQSHFYSAEARIGSGESRAALGRAIESLIESRRSVVQLYLLNLDIDEISDHFRWSQHKTRNLLYRGLADIRRIMGGADHHEGHNT